MDMKGPLLTADYAKLKIHQVTKLQHILTLHYHKNMLRSDKGFSVNPEVDSSSFEVARIAFHDFSIIA